jgi:hypothetical protein
MACLSWGKRPLAISANPGIPNKNLDERLEEAPMSTATFRSAITTVAVLVGFISIGYSQTFITFDAPGTNATSPVAINPAGQITGTFDVDATFSYHGFLRETDGTITTFDPTESTISTQPMSINPAGQITGFFGPSSGGLSGFLRDADGTFTTFEAPGSLFTEPTDINPAGEITGNYLAGSFHGFLRRKDGTFATFDVVGSYATYPHAINPAGQITGEYQANNAAHGFLRKRDGTLITFEVSGSRATSPRAIDPAGQITGEFLDANYTAHGFCGGAMARS